MLSWNPAGLIVTGLDQTDDTRRLLENAAGLFSGGKSAAAKSEEELTAPLYEEIGRLKMDIKWLEKKL